MLQRFKEILQYRIDDVFARGPVAQFALLLTLAALVLATGVFAYVLFVFDPASPGGWLAPLWWSMGRVFAIDVDHETATFVALATVVVALMGVVIFGILIGFVSSAIEERLESLRKGDSKVMERGHVLILGWSTKVASVLRLLAMFRADMRVVVLAPREVAAMQEALRLEGVYDLGMKIVLRTGQPGNLAELKRVAFDKAFGIVVVAADDDGTDRSDPDIEAIKTVMLLASFDQWAAARPKMVAEISQRRNLEVARIASRHRVPIVSSSELISKVIVQSARQPGISKVYSEIFAVERNEIYIQGFPQCCGRRFGDIAFAFPAAVPIGVSRARTHDGIIRFIPELNPPPDYVVKDDEWIILLAADDKIDCRIDTPAHTTGAPAPAPFVQAAPERVLILGWNHNIYVILGELDQYAGPGTVVDVVSSYADAEVEERLQTHGADSFRHIGLRHVRGDMTSRSVLTKMHALSYGCVIILADESNPDGDPDAMTIMTLILLRDMQAQAGTVGVRVVSEIVEQRNREMILSTHVDDMVISSLFVSMLLAQISQQQMLHAVYDELLSAGGMEFYLKPAGRYVEPGTQCSFRELIAIAQKGNEVALGVQIAGHEDDEARNFGIELNPSKDASWRLGEHDKVIVLAAHLYD